MIPLKGFGRRGLLLLMNVTIKFYTRRQSENCLRRGSCE